MVLNHYYIFWKSIDKYDKIIVREYRFAFLCGILKMHYERKGL